MINTLRLSPFTPDIRFGRSKKNASLDNLKPHEVILKNAEQAKADAYYRTEAPAEKKPWFKRGVNPLAIFRRNEHGFLVTQALHDARIKKHLLFVQEAQDPFEKDMVAYLKRKIQDDAKAFAKRYQKGYQENKNLREHFDRMFKRGYKVELPTAQEIETLTLYFALKSCQEKSSKALGKKVPELEFYTKAYSLLSYASREGDIFTFVKQENALNKKEQSDPINTVALKLALGDELDVASQIDALRSLHQKKLELDKLLVLARADLNQSSSILETAESKPGMKEQRIQSARLKIEKFTQQRQAVEKLLDFSKNDLIQIRTSVLDLEPPPISVTSRPTSVSPSVKPSVVSTMNDDILLPGESTSKK